MGGPEDLESTTLSLQLLSLRIDRNLIIAYAWVAISMLYYVIAYAY